MSTWQHLGTKPELLGKVPFSVKLDRQQIALFHYDGQFRAIGNSCNHRGGPLCEGRLHGEYVMCPWHAWEWDCRTGVNDYDPDLKLATYPVKIEGEDILIDIP